MKVPWAIDQVRVYIIRDKTRLSGESVETQLSKYRRSISCCLDELSSMISDKSLNEHVLMSRSLDNCLLISRFDDERFDEMTINNQNCPDVCRILSHRPTRTVGFVDNYTILSLQPLAFVSIVDWNISVLF